MGFEVLRSVGSTKRDTVPSSAMSSPVVSAVNGIPVISETPSSRSRVDCGMSSGHACAPIRAIAAARRVIGLSSFTIEPWPAVPCASSRSHAMPFSAVWTR